MLEVFERNEFRNLLHLRLAMVQASADDACKHLAKKLLVHKRVNIELQAEVEEQREKIEQDEEMLAGLQAALQKLKYDNDLILAEKDDESRDKLRALEAQHASTIANTAASHAAEIDNMKLVHEAEMLRLQEEAQMLREQVQSLAAQKEKLLEESAVLRQKAETMQAN